jgi:phospholipid/cholesterol/gamma-HCH transport system substrate-binding protein
MSDSAAETVIGAVVLAVAGGFIFYAAQHSDFGTGGDYEVTAVFRKADGLTVGGDVRISGVKVGSIRQVSLDPKSYSADVRMSIADGVQIPDDSAATVASDGLLGGAHVSIQPGGSEFMLDPGGEITITQGSVNLMDLIGRAVTGGEK